jgi:hypothetical protein
VRWNFNIQKEIAKDLIMELGYIGSIAEDIPVTREINYIPNEFLSTSLVRDQANIDRLTANVANPFRTLLPGTSLNGNSVGVEQLLRPYPQFNGQGGVVAESLPVGYSNFHMLQARLDKRFSNGFQFLANFQWSKFMEATGYLYGSAPKLEYRIAGEDRPLRLVLSGTYDLPFGKGKRFGAGSGPWMNRLIGGWQINGILNSQSGAPVGWGNAIYYGGDLNWKARNVNGVFDTTRFETNAQRQLDRNQRTFNSAFSSYRSDAVNNVDLSVIKNIPVTEQLRVQFRAESFNAFNRPIFNGPTTDPVNRNFGLITSQANLPRTYQLALRVTF